MIELARSTHFLVEKLDSGKVFAAEPSICTEVNGVPICFKLDESLAKKVLSAFGIDASKLLLNAGPADWPDLKRSKERSTAGP